MKRFLAALLFALCLLACSRADIGPPPGKTIMPVTTVVEATEDYPDYAFFKISWSSRPGPPPHGGSSRSVTLHFFAPNTTIKATGERRSGGALYGVPRSFAEKMQGWKGFAEDAAKHNPPKHSTVSTSDDSWFKLAESVRKGEVPGAISIPFGTTKELPDTQTYGAITETYRIARTPAGVDFVKPDPVSDAVRGERGDCGNSGPERSIPWKWIAAGGAGSLALLLGGGLLVWRIARRA